MPEKDGKLTSPEKQKAADWLNGKTKSSVLCPVCGNADWGIADYLVSNHVYTPGGGLVVGGRSVPEVVTFCIDCGYARHFLAVPILGPKLDGNLEQENKDEASTKEEVGAKNG